MARNSEFTVEDAYRYNQSGPLRWIVSHVLRYWWFALVAAAGYLTAWLVYSQARVVTGQAAEEILNPSAVDRLLPLALTILALLMVDGFSILIGSYAAENVAARIEADARQELYGALLGKSQTFHDRQRVGDLMARATDDANQLSNMIVPGSTLLFETLLGLIVPLSFITSIKPELVLVPIGFVLSYIVAVRAYMRRLNPVIADQREQYGTMNAGLEETISGIEVVKASARELFERGKFRRNARLFRDFFVKQGYIEARYLPLLIYGVAVGLTFLHALWLYRAGTISLADVIAVTGLMNLLRFPTFISLFAFSLVQSGMASARRILAIIAAETELDENRGGLSQPIAGGITFENVDFAYGEKTVLRDVSLAVKPGQTVAVVGQTGSGKTALTQLINRTYDVAKGRVLIDGADVREWNLDALRSQISKIEQDVFLFSRSVADNIAFGAPGASREQVEQAARAAQAHEFISGFAQGYDTVVGERGVTLSGGQRQRIALARAFLSDPRILILDDSTSAIDSATEDQIQKAIRRAQAGRTTILITHRLAQIRWADLIVVLDEGQVVACGSHERLLRQSAHYRRIFARFDAALPPLEPALA
ncbi:MAG TPA: ABC transporter ATP-binding protein [Herpetosiphonaceae bacterium]